MAGKPKNGDTARRNAPATEYERTAREADAAAVERKAAETIAKGRLPGKASSAKPSAPRTARGPKPSVEDEP